MPTEGMMGCSYGSVRSARIFPFLQTSDNEPGVGVEGQRAEKLSRQDAVCFGERVSEDLDRAKTCFRRTMQIRCVSCWIRNRLWEWTLLTAMKTI